jgi:lysophospholipase L1-like esterase
MFLVLLLLFIALFGLLFHFQSKKLANDRPDTFPRKGELPHAVATDKTIMVCVGDSITHGSVSVNYVDMLQNRLGANFYLYNAGVNSDTTYSLLARLEDIIACKPEFITLLIGTNDVNATLSDSALKSYWDGGKIAKNHTPTFAEYQANYTAIVNRLKAETKAEIALLSLPPMGEILGDTANNRATEYSNFIRQTAENQGLIYVPINETLLDYLQKNPPKKQHAFEDTRRLLVLTIGAAEMFGISFDRMSDFWGFQLLTDNLHLNTRAATMVADLVFACRNWIK